MDLAHEAPAAHSVFKRLRTYGQLVMFPHTLFSIPFGIVSMLMAAGGLPPFWQSFWIVIALVSARTAANALNRLVDKDIDARNPRTAGRDIPQGKVTAREALMLVAACFALLVLAAFMLRPVCVFLLPVPLFLIILYSYTKRFTWLCHIVLGAASACAPVGAWLAVTGGIGLMALALGAAVTLWVAGFDIIYALLDVTHDREEGLHSIPKRFGMRIALAVSAIFHIAAAALLFAAGMLAGLGMVYSFGVAIISVLLICEHIMISPNRTGKIKTASYTVNQIVSVAFLIFSGADILI